VTKVEIYAVNYAEERKQKPVESVVMQRQQKQPSSYFLMQDQNHCVGVCVCVCESINGLYYERYVGCTL